jgi:hypothetical protein
VNADMDRARTLAHYGAILAELEHPTTHRLSIEVTSLDPGVDLATCTFAVEAGSGTDPTKRHVRQTVNGRTRMVGLWRILTADRNA